MKRRLLTLMLATFMMFSGFVGVRADNFPDVAEDHPNLTAINYLAEKGIVQGYGDGTFKPDATVTRAEFVKMLAGFAEWNIEYSANIKTGFPDVDATETTAAHWAFKEIKSAADQKIINGFEDGTFRPDDTVKYEEAMKMLVCYLGREEQAKSNAAELKVDVWPNGYINVGNTLLISKNVVCPIGENATRAMVAQMIYNIKDLERTFPETIIPIATPSRGNGGGGGGGGGSSNKNDKDYEGTAFGKIVAVAETTNDGKREYFLDDNIYFKGEPIKKIGKSQVVLKTNIQIDGNDYVLFETGGADYSRYLGYDLRIDFKYWASDDVYKINKITNKDMEVLEIDASNIDRARTIAANQDGADYVIIKYYEDSGKLTEKRINNYKIIDMIYNNALVRPTTVPTATPTVKPTATPTITPTEEPGETPDATQEPGESPSPSPSQSPAASPNEIVLEDFLPVEGKLTIIEGINNISLVRVEAYETYVVSSVNGASTPKYITDRYRKDANGTAVKLELDDRWSSERTLEIVDKNGKALTFSSINSRSILSVAKSKDGSYTKVVNSSQQLSSMEVRQIEDNKITLGTTEYETNWYFQEYSSSMPQFERGDKIIAYLDKNNKITWIEISPTNYDIGYIMEAYIDNTSMKNDLIIKIYTGSTSIACTTTKNTKVTMYDEDLGEQNGQPVKDLSSDEILKRLKKQASIINEGKPNAVIYNATASQPIRYSVSDGKLTSLLAVKLDENTKYTQETGSYTYMTAPVSSFLTGSGETISIPTSNATIMFVPNNRVGWGVTGYRSGSLSSVSDKLKVGMPYNVDSFYLPASDGETLERRVFVIYNESIDAKPTFTSENIVVSELKEVVGGAAGTTYEITPFSGTGSKSSYRLYDRSKINAYVLDENFERKKDEKGNDIRRMVEVGDVIRFGYCPNGEVAEIELVFDINKDLSERKAIAKESNGRTIALSDVNLDAARISYFGRVGLITDIREESCIMMLNEGNTPQQSSLYINKNHENVTVYLYNPENKKTPIQLANMSQVYPGDMIFVQQSANLYTKYIYVVRYENSLVNQVNVQDDNQENLSDKADTESVPPVEENKNPEEEPAVPVEPSDIEEGQKNEPALAPEEEQKTEGTGPNEAPDLVAPGDISLPEAVLPSTEETQETAVEPEV